MLVDAQLGASEELDNKVYNDALQILILVAYYIT